MLWSRIGTILHQLRPARDRARAHSGLSAMASLNCAMASSVLPCFSIDMGEVGVGVRIFLDADGFKEVGGGLIGLTALESSMPRLIRRI